jgi:hypothetical protein
MGVPKSTEMPPSLRRVVKVMSLNEKTLELNISTEFLNICRQHDPQAFMFGTTLKQESRSGYDSTALGNLPQFWRTAVFQFKRALSKRITALGDEYTFHINNNGNRDQHIFLYLMSGGRPLTALYVLPLFITLNDLRNQAPQLLGQTVYADAAHIPPWIIDNTPHTLLVYPAQGFAIIHSEERRIKVSPFKELTTSIAEKKIGVTIEELRANLKRQRIEGAETKSRRPKFTFHTYPT